MRLDLGINVIMGGAGEAPDPEPLGDIRIPRQTAHIILGDRPGTIQIKRQTVHVIVVEQEEVG